MRALDKHSAQKRRPTDACAADLVALRSLCCRKLVALRSSGLAGIVVPQDCGTAGLLASRNSKHREEAAPQVSNTQRDKARDAADFPRRGACGITGLVVAQSSWLEQLGTCEGKSV